MFKNLTKEKLVFVLASAVASIFPLISKFILEIPNDIPCNFFFGEPEYPSEKE